MLELERNADLFPSVYPALPVLCVITSALTYLNTSLFVAQMQDVTELNAVLNPHCLK